MNLIALLFVLLYAILLSTKYGGRLAIAAALLLSMSLPSIPLYAFGVSRGFHYGIAPAVPTLTLVMVVTAVLVLAIPYAELQFHFVVWVAVLSGLLLLLIYVVWGGHQQQFSGAIFLVLATVSYGCGRWLASRPAGTVTHLMALTATLVMGLHATAALMQSVGVPVFWPGTATTASEWVEMNRMVGLYGHPSTLGKTALLLLPFLLPATTASRAGTRRLAYLGLSAAVIGTLLTLSRANSVAVLSAVLLFVLAQRARRRGGAKIFAIALICAVLAASRDRLDALVARQRLDEAGGYRDQLLDIGLHQISQSPWLGIGPNFYSSHVGRYDSFAARGFPVHNSFLLLAAEIGIVLAVFFFAPLAISCVNATRRLLSVGRTDARALALVAMVPSIAVVTLTGWGMDAMDTLPLWFFAVGYLGSRSPQVEIAPAPKVSDRLALD